MRDEPTTSALRLRPVKSAADWEAARAIREQVFVIGQDCPPHEEFDGLDPQCRHVLGEVDGRPVATARWRVVERDGRAVAKLERFAVLAEHRGRGFGHALLRYLMSEARAAGCRDFLLHAQDHLRSFYAPYGFVPVGEVFLESSIPHVKMVYDPGACEADRVREAS